MKKRYAIPAILGLFIACAGCVSDMRSGAYAPQASSGYVESNGSFILSDGTRVTPSQEPPNHYWLELEYGNLKVDCRYVHDGKDIHSTGDAWVQFQGGQLGNQEVAPFKYTSVDGIETITFVGINGRLLSPIQYRRDLPTSNVGEAGAFLDNARGIAKFMCDRSDAIVRRGTVKGLGK